MKGFETGDLKYIYKNKLHKANSVYASSKYLANRTVSDKILKYRAYEIALNPNTDGYLRRLASMVHKLFNKKVELGAKANVNKVIG